MDQNAKDNETISSELSDRSWLPFSAENRPEFPTSHDSNDFASIASSSNASLPPFPSYLANALSPGPFPNIPTESHLGINNLQGPYAPEYNPHPWHTPEFSNQQFEYAQPNGFTEPFYSLGNDGDFHAFSASPYEQHVPQFGIPQSQVHWQTMSNLLSTGTSSDSILTSSVTSGPFQIQLPFSPIPSPTSGITPNKSSKKSTQIIETNTRKMSHRRAQNKPKIARRSRPLDAQAREKADKMREVGACWRCRKYKKPCNGSSGVCDSCQVPGFRVWPSELGCRRERLDSLVLFLLPSHMEERLHYIPDGWTKGRTWRVLKPTLPLNNFKLADESTSSQWAISKREARSVLLFDVEFVELASIAERYQNTRAKPVEALEVSCKLMIATCKLYQCFVSTPDNTNNIEFGDMVRRASAVRAALRRTFLLVQQLCLSTKRTDWFPAFLSACLATCAAIVFIDTAIAVPSPVRELIWGDFHETRYGLRDNGYQLLVDLLRASTNGVNPIQQECWKPSCASETKELQYGKDRHVLLGVDSAALDGLMALKAWQDKYRLLLDEGRDMLASGAALARIQAIAGMSKMFDF